MDGKLEKLKIISYSDPKFSKKDGEFEAPFNPEEFTEKYVAEFNNEAPQGSVGTDQKFDKVQPQKYDLKLRLDGTGVARNSYSFGSALSGNKEVESVPDQIKRFRKVATSYSGDTHQVKYVLLIWGPNIFAGRVLSVDITYTLFKPDGTPLRAELIVSIEESIEKNKELRKKNASSPDLTHIRVVKEGDTLPLMTYRIYGDTSYYLEVARVNGLTDFRHLMPGTKIVFPPLDKTA